MKSPALRIDDRIERYAAAVTSSNEYLKTVTAHLDEVAAENAGMFSAIAGAQPELLPGQPWWKKISKKTARWVLGVGLAAITAVFNEYLKGLLRAAGNWARHIG